MDSSKCVTHTYFPAFDVFRGIGIIAVILAHTPTRNPLLRAAAPLGALGVHMFFALSGFLITYRLIAEDRQTGAIDLYKFYRRRARRILPSPVIYLAALIALGPVLHRISTSPREIWASLFFYRNLIQPPVANAWYTSHFWSLSLEEQFYLAWPAFLALLGPRRIRTSAASILIILLTALWRHHVDYFGGRVNIYRPDLLADHLLWGCVIALHWDQMKLKITPSFRKWTGRCGIFSAIALIYWQPAFWQPVFPISVAAGFIFSADAAQAWTRRCTVFQLLGRASYDCYIWQMLFLPLPLLGTHLPAAQRFPWNYALIAVCTAGSYAVTFPRKDLKWWKPVA